MREMRGDWSQDDVYFAENMARKRVELGWTQGELARRLREAGLDNMHQTTVSRIEKGERVPRLGEARGIAKVLGVNVGYMIAPPEGVQVGDALLRAISDVEREYSGVTSAAERLHIARITLEASLSQAQHTEVPGWYADALAAIRRRGEAALKWLTINHATEDRHRDDEEMFYEQYREEG